MARDAVFRSWMNPRAQEYRRIYDIPDHIGTAVNVQMMVFGNTGDRSATGVGFTRNPATGAKEFYGEFLDQRPGRGRRRRHPHAAADRRAREGDAEGLPRAAADHDAPREALQGRPGLRVHDPGRAAVHAADAQRQAHRLRRGGDRHRPGRRAAHHAEGGVLQVDPENRCRSCSRPASTRRSGRRSRWPPGPAGLARRRLRPGGLHGRRRGGVGRAGQEGRARARRRCPTTSTACSWRRASSRPPAA
jgi:hypothetical protein